MPSSKQQCEAQTLIVQQDLDVTNAALETTIISYFLALRGDMVFFMFYGAKQIWFCDEMMFQSHFPSDLPSQGCCSYNTQKQYPLLFTLLCLESF